MFFSNSSFIAWLNRPYFDLGPFNGGPIHLYGIELSYHQLISETSKLYGVQVNHPPSFRESLLRETSMTQYQVDNPLKLAPELRTERWNKLCKYLRHYQELQPLIQLKVIHLLRSLCLHKAVLEYVPEMSEFQIGSNPVLASLALARAMSNLMLKFDNGTLNNLDELEIIATNAPSDNWMKISAALFLVAQYAKTFNNLAKVELWGSLATKEIQNIKPSLNDFDYEFLMSTYYRAISFIPLMHGDKDKVIQEMDLCQNYAENLTCNHEIQQKIADENLNIVLESRTKEALWLGNLDLAEERARQVLERMPLDPRYHLELGQILIKQVKIQEAAKAYLSASCLGPPGTAIAYFMAGQCYQSLAELEMACDCYLACLRIDPLAISAVERLTKLAPRLGNLALANWSQLRLTELQNQKKRMSAKDKHSYTNAVSAEKTATEKMTA